MLLIIQNLNMHRLLHLLIITSPVLPLLGGAWGCILVCYLNLYDVSALLAMCCCLYRACELRSFLSVYPNLQIPDYRNAVIVARHPGAVKRATSYAERLRLSIAVIHGEEKTESERDDGRNSPPPEGSESRNSHMQGMQFLPGISQLFPSMHSQ